MKHDHIEFSLILLFVGLLSRTEEIRNTTDHNVTKDAHIIIGYDCVSFYLCHNDDIMLEHQINII